MKRNLQFIVGCALGIAAVAILIGLNVDGGKQLSFPAQAEPSRTLEAQTKSENEVSITVTPSFTDSWRFDISLETHSVELSQALEQVSVLVDDTGKEYTAGAWEGSPPGGHHRSGTLFFSDVNPSAKTLTLKIRDIGGVPERTFAWSIQQ